MPEDASNVDQLKDKSAYDDDDSQYDEVADDSEVQIERFDFARSAAAAARPARVMAV